MAILNRDTFFTRLHERLGDDTSDESISFLEDMTDTYNDLEQRANNGGEDWEKKYHDLDESWKARYRHRFFSGGDSAIPSGSFAGREETEETYNPEAVKVDDLFSKGEK